HGDASLYGAHQAAHVAADADILLDRVKVDRVAAGARQHLDTAGAMNVHVLPVNLHVICHWYPVPANGLMGPVLTGDVAQATVNALTLIDLGHDFVIQIQLTPTLDSWHRLADEVADVLKAFLQHPVLQPAGHVFDDPEPVVHDGGADLDAAGAEQQEF